MRGREERSEREEGVGSGRKGRDVKFEGCLA